MSSSSDQSFKRKRDGDPTSNKKTKNEGAFGSPGGNQQKGTTEKPVLSPMVNSSLSPPGFKSEILPKHTKPIHFSIFQGEPTEKTQTSGSQPLTFTDLDKRIENTTSFSKVQAPIKKVESIRFRIGENGKIHYFQRDDTSTQQSRLGEYVEMSPKDFSVFKGGGKRYGSNKITDLETMQSYVHDGISGQFYEFDKNSQDHLGKLVVDQKTLQKKKKDGLLLDRSRENRIGKGVEPFDVGHYKKVPEGSKMDALSGKKDNFGANRDHVVSGKSLRLRSSSDGINMENQRYEEGLAIAIPNKMMHIPLSPTFGGKQHSKDTIDGVEMTRVKHDEKHPSHGFFRDVKTMLTGTKDQNGGSQHPKLDLSNPENRLTQIGGYRTLFKGNVKMNSINPKTGFDPTEKGFDLTHVSKNNDPNSVRNFVSVTSNDGKSQGRKIAELFTDTLKSTGKAK